MYVPRAFAENDTLTLHEQMQATALPVLITQSRQGLMASHVPLLLKPEEGQYGTLYGHLARANPQCEELTKGAQALIIFVGEQAYISPSFYPSKAEHGKAVPTWNYVAVHAYAQPVHIPTGPMELNLPAIKGIGGAPLYLVHADDLKAYLARHEESFHAVESLNAQADAHVESDNLQDSCP